MIAATATRLLLRMVGYDAQSDFQAFKSTLGGCSGSVSVPVLRMYVTSEYRVDGDCCRLQQRIAEDRVDDNIAGVVTLELRLAELREELRKLPVSRENADDRADILVKLVKTLHSSKRLEEATEMAVQLCDEHTQHNFFAEAAAVLLLAAAEMPWDDDAQEKEQLYMKVVNLFAKGHVPERAMSLLRELQLRYEQVGDYSAAAGIAERQVSLLREATEGANSYSVFYYSVAFSGNGAPEDLRDSQYVYRTHERLEPFVTSLKKRYPAALVNADDKASAHAMCM